MPLGLPSRTYKPGEVIHKEGPFVKILLRNYKDEFCEACHCRSFSLRSCGQCLAVKYCGKVCQRKDWRDHRLECKNMKNLQDEKGVDVVRLIGRVILKIKGKEWKSIKTTVLGTEVNFDDIDPHYKEMTENPMLNLFYKEVQEQTKQFIGVSNTPSDIDMLKIIGKVIFNSLSSSEDSFGVCFFLGMSVFDKQCIPNSSFMIYKNNATVWANKNIYKNSEKISVSFRRIFDTSLRFCKEIDDQPCKCSDCSLPYGESVFSRILDDKKAYSVISVTEAFLKKEYGLLDFCFEYVMKGVADKILERHSGVLGRTNLLHLKLLGVRFLNIGGHAIEIEEGTKKLESIMSSIFGEYSREMLLIYYHLTKVYEELGLLEIAAIYINKIRKISDNIKRI